MKIHVVLTKQDADIAAFKKSMPRGQWSKHVVQIMTAALRDRVADIPMDFRTEPLDKNHHTKISLSEKTAQRFREKFGCEKGRFTPGIKAEIRKCIRKNLRQETEMRFSSAELTDAFGQFRHRVDEKSKALDSVREKHKLVHKEYRRAFRSLCDTLSDENRKETQI